MNFQPPTSRLLPSLIFAAFLSMPGVMMLDCASAASALGKAAGKYKVTFRGTAKLGAFELPINARGTMKLPRGKGRARLRLNVNDVPIAFSAKIRSAKEIQGGKKVKYRGTSVIPDSALGLGRMTGPFRGTVKLAKKPKVNARTNLTSDSGIKLSGPLKGKK